MFWATNMVETATLSDLLKKDGVTLREVLSDDYTLQELKNGNQPLIDYLTQPKIVEELVTNALTPPPATQGVDEKEKFKVSHQSCEVLTINSDELAKAVIGSDLCRKLIGGFFASSDRLNTLVTSFYTRIITQLLSKSPTEMLDILKNGSFLDDAFKHMDVSAVMDLLYRLVNVPSQQQDSDAVKKWYVERNIAGRLADLFVPSQSGDVHSNASNLWSEMVRVLRDYQYTSDEKREDLLLDSLQGTDALRALLSNMFPENGIANESVVVNGSVIFMALLQSNFIPNSPDHLASAALDAQPNWGGGPPGASTEVAPTALSDQVWQPDPTRIVENVLCERLEAISSYLSSSTQTRPLRLPMGEIKQPLGNGKISIVKLFACLLNTNHLPTHQKIVGTDLLKNLLRSAYDFPFNNFLHLAVVQCVQYVLFTRLSSDVSPLIGHLISYCRLPAIVMEHADTVSKESSRIMRVQLKAHTMNLAQWFDVGRLRGPNKETVAALLDELGLAERWSIFVESVLVPYQKANESDNVDMPTGPSTLAEESEMPGTDAAGTQAFSDYQMQSMTNTIPDNMGLPMDTFTANPDNDIDALAAKANMVDFNVKEQLDDTPPGEASFEALCATRISGAALPDRRSTIVEPFGFNEKPEDAWPGDQTSSSSAPFDAKFAAFPVTWNESASNSEKTSAQSSSKMDVDKDDWPSGSTKGTEDAGWADFGSARSAPPPSTGASGDAWANFDQLGSRADFVSPVCIGIAAATSLSTKVDPLLLSPAKSGAPSPKPETESTC